MLRFSRCLEVDVFGNEFLKVWLARSMLIRFLRNAKTASRSLLRDVRRQISILTRYGMYLANRLVEEARRCRDLVSALTYLSIAGLSIDRVVPIRVHPRTARAAQKIVARILDGVDVEKLIARLAT